MNNLKIQAKFISAFNKNNIDRNHLINTNFISNDYNQNNGRIACHYSHIMVLKYFLKSNKKNCIIFEDDIKKIDFDTFKSKHQNILIESLNKLPKDYDILYFGRCWDDCKKQNYLTNNLVKVNSPKCRHSYAVSRKGAQKIIKYSLPMRRYAGDTIIARLITKGLISAYSITPPIFFQNRSQLGSNLNNKDALKECH